MTERTTPLDPAASGTPSARHRGRVRTEDGLDLVWQAWTPPSPRGVIAVIHGLAEHSGRYQETAEALAARGWAVYACDLRSHGLSPDLPGAGRVHVGRFRDYFRDVSALLGLARERHAGVPVFLLGHSMGGLISIRYALEHPGDLAGVVISSPALGVHPDALPALPLRIMVRILSLLAPRLRIDSGLDTNAISRDPNVVQLYNDDPLVSSKVSARWYAELLKSIKQAHRDAASLRIPMLLMQSGADRLVDPQAPGNWASAVPAANVELVIWQGLYHEMFNEPEKDRVRERVLEWLEDIIASHQNDRVADER